jgi:integrase
MGLGPIDVVSLKAARERARDARALVIDGVDPIEDRLAKQDARKKAEHENITFKTAAKEYWTLHESGWKNAKHRVQWRTSLERYAYPHFGDRPVKALDDAVINAALTGIWQTIPETAARVRNRIERVIAWTKAGMPLPRPKTDKSNKNHPALPYVEIPAFMVELRQREGSSFRALDFLILTAARTAEVLGAKWDEIDFANEVWTVPAARMKAGKEHRVPLSELVIELLKSLPRERGNDHVFIGSRAGRGLSPMSMLESLRGLRSGLTVHGFRSSFKDWAAERTNYPNMISEMALAHTVGNKVEAAYRRGDLLEKRRRLMCDWAKYCSAKPALGANVVSIR